MNNKQWLIIARSYGLGWFLRVISLLLGGKLTRKFDKPLQEFRRIIEIGESQVRFADCLRNPRINNYLGLLTKAKVDSAKLASYVIQTDSYFGLKRNNAEILILSEIAELERIWFFDEYKHAEYLFCAPNSFQGAIASLPGLVKNAIFRRIKIEGIVKVTDLQGIEQAILVVAILKRVTPNARRFVSPLLGVEKFFASLNQQQVSYAILRWFETLPQIEPGEDIDMLVADRDLETVESFLQQQPGIIPCDIYSVSGLPGTSYRNMAYYPPLLAERILTETILQQEIFAVPNSELHFYSLAYHAIYHKGEKSGIPWSLEEEAGVERHPEHQYQQILQDLATGLDLKVEITLQGLDRFLHDINWRPSEDTLARLDSSNIWLKAFAKEATRAKPSTDITGLAVFFIRQKALDLDLETEIVELIEREGFSIVKSKHLGEKKAWRVKHQIRGGNWGKGPWAESGGDPGMVIVALDLMPIPPTSEQLAKQPHLSNGRIGVKNKIRNRVNSYLSPEQQCNAVHSSDNEREAWNYLEIAFPNKLKKIQQRINQLKADFETKYAVRQVLTRFGRRAKVEVIQYDRELAVKKTFRPKCDKFLQREKYVCQTFGTECAAIPTLLDWGDNYLVYPYYNDRLQFRNRQSKLLPLWVAKEAIATLRFFYDRGYALIDFQPANIIVDRIAGLKAIDYEFLYQYQTKPESFEQCYELAGIPPDFAGDKPNFKLEMSYDKRWKPYVGLSLTSLLNDPAWLQHGKRFFFALVHLPLRAIDNRIQLILSQKNSRLSSFFTLNRAGIKKIIFNSIKQNQSSKP